MSGRKMKGATMSDSDHITDDAELERHIWKEDTVIVNGQQMTIMYPPESTDGK
jgi:hypothetical protein